MKAGRNCLQLFVIAPICTDIVRTELSGKERKQRLRPKAARKLRKETSGCQSVRLSVCGCVVLCNQNTQLREQMEAVPSGQSPFLSTSSIFLLAPLVPLRLKRGLSGLALYGIYILLLPFSAFSVSICFFSCLRFPFPPPLFFFFCIDQAVLATATKHVLDTQVFIPKRHGHIERKSELFFRRGEILARSSVSSWSPPPPPPFLLFSFLLSMLAQSAALHQPTKRRHRFFPSLQISSVLCFYFFSSVSNTEMLMSLSPPRRKVCLRGLMQLSDGLPQLVKTLFLGSMSCWIISIHSWQSRPCLSFPSSYFET